MHGAGPSSRNENNYSVRRKKGGNMVADYIPVCVGHAARASLKKCLDKPYLSRMGTDQSALEPQEARTSARETHPPSAFRKSPKASLLHLLLSLADCAGKRFARASQHVGSCRPLGILRTKSLRWQPFEGRPRRVVSPMRPATASGRSTRATPAHAPVTTANTSRGARSITLTWRW